MIDPPPPSCMGADDGSHAEEGADQIGVEHLSERLQVAVDQWGDPDDAGVVDQDVDAVEPGHRLVDRRAPRLFGGDVERHIPGRSGGVLVDAGGRISAEIVTLVGQNDPGPFGRKARRSGGADAAGRPGHQGHLSIQSSRQKSAPVDAIAVKALGA